MDRVCSIAKASHEAPAFLNISALCGDIQECLQKFEPLRGQVHPNQFLRTKTGSPPTLVGSCNSHLARQSFQQIKASRLACCVPIHLCP